MDLPRPIFHSFYDTVIRNIFVATAVVREKSMKKAAAQEKQICEEKGQIDGITVSDDGSWKREGFSSLYGIASLIGWHTGKVVDVLVKSEFCKNCEFWKDREGIAKYEEWAESHINECQINHEGSAGKIEVDAIVEMFSRSETLHGIKYSNYVGDRDSKTFQGITDVQHYNDIIVRKIECINHVQKRMGTRLYTLKKNIKGLGRKGKLTGKLIDELTVFYGLAIRRNHDSTENMKKEIWATLYHKISTDEKSQHQYCPVGENSWCTWQKAKASNKLSDYTHNLLLRLKF